MHNNNAFVQFCLILLHNLRLRPAAKKALIVELEQSHRDLECIYSDLGWVSRFKREIKNIYNVYLTASENIHDVHFSVSEEEIVKSI